MWHCDWKITMILFNHGISCDFCFLLSLSQVFLFIYLTFPRTMSCDILFYINTCLTLKSSNLMLKSTTIMIHRNFNFFTFIQHIIFSLFHYFYQIINLSHHFINFLKWLLLTRGVFEKLIINSSYRTLYIWIKLFKYKQQKRN